MLILYIVALVGIVIMNHLCNKENAKTIKLYKEAYESEKRTSDIMSIYALTVVMNEYAAKEDYCNAQKCAEMIKQIKEHQ